MPRKFELVILKGLRLYNNVSPMRLFSSIVCSLLVACSTIGAHSQPTNNGWMLTQKHTVYGRQTICIGADGFRIDNQDSATAYLVDKLAGTVTAINLKRKVRYSMPIDKFRNRMIQVISGYANDDLRSLKWVPSGRKTELGPGDSLWFKAYSTYVSHAETHGYLEGKPYHQTSLYQLLVSKQIHLSRELSMVLAEIEGTPDLHGVPLKEVTQYGVNDIKRYFLETQELKPIHLDNSKWKVPESFSPVADLPAVTSGDGRLLNEMLGH